MSRKLVQETIDRINDLMKRNALAETYLDLSAKDNEESCDFGIFSETKLVKISLQYEDGSDPEFNYSAAAALYTWNNMTRKDSTDASEGSKCWSFDIAAGKWFGMGVFLPNHRNMKNYSEGLLHFDIKTTSKTPMSVGIKSSRGGEAWLDLGDETSEFGFPRDGKWHKVTVPLNRFEKIDFYTVHQMFMLKGDPPSSAFNLSIDNVWWQPK